jgi:hypothetical protein
VQVRIVGRMDTWVGHGLSRATTRPARIDAIVQGLFSFVEAERDAWGVLAASGGFDHHAMHGVRARWAVAFAEDVPDRATDATRAAVERAAQAAVAALLGAVGLWVNQGVDPSDVVDLLVGVRGRR